MAVAADPYTKPKVVRRPGDFERHGEDGAPYVAHPTKTTKRDGLKADLIAQCVREGIEVPEGATVAVLHELLGPRPVKALYGRPSGLGKQIENTTNLQKWAERMEALGIGMDPGLAAAAAALAHMDRGSPEFRIAADKIAKQAKDVAQAGLAAERGTHTHNLTEDVDRDRDPIERMARGEELDLPPEVQHALIAAWEQMLATFDIEILATEAPCVDDEWKVAGTLDRICRLRKPLHFITATGEVVELPAGWVGVLDIKSGRLRLGRDGFVDYWLAYAVQCAAYAKSVPYDTETDTRGDWAEVLGFIDQQWAIIAHLDVLAALDGEAACRLILVDIAAGRAAGDLCVAAGEWEKRRDVFSIPVDELTVRVAVPYQIPSAPCLADGGATQARNGSPVPASAPDPLDQRNAVHARPAPDDGDDVGADFPAVRTAYAELDTFGKQWIAELQSQATAAGVTFHAKDATYRRRWEIIRALTLLAQAGETDDDTLRALLEPIIGPCAQYPSVPVGHLVGSLSATEAATFGQLVDGRLAIHIDPQGRPSLRPAA